MKKAVKELKSKYDDLRRYFETAITVGHVAEGLKCCDGNDEAARVREQMRSLDFDVMSLKINGIVEGYVCRERLNWHM